MKKLTISILVTICVQSIFSQTVDSISFCHNKLGQLSLCNTSNYSLKFANQKIKSFATTDSSVTYEFDSKYFQIKKNNKIAITAQLDNKNGYVIVEDKRNNSVYIKKFLNESSSCISQPNNLVDAYNDSVMITFNYTYCRLIALGIVDVNLGSFNFAIYQCPGKKVFSWDITFNQMDKSSDNFLKGVKVISDRKYGEPLFVSFFDDHRENVRFSDPLAGIEISTTSKKANKFDTIQRARIAKKSNMLVYEDLFFYDKKGKVKFSFAPVEFCQ